MKDRSDLLQRIRPSIPTVHEDGSSEAEHFQNTTLRPILKFQNELLLRIFRHYLQRRKMAFEHLSTQQKRALIEQAVQNDLRFKDLLVGLVAGHFTVEEWAVFEAHEAELRRRIAGLVIQRLHSQLAGEWA